MTARQQIVSRSADPQYAAAARDVRSSPLWAHNREQLGNVLAQSNPQGARDLATLAQQRPSPLLQRDSQNQTALSNLNRLSTAPLAPNTFSRDALVNGALSDVSRPQSITQGSAGTCGVASVLQPLAANRPAEYTRLATDLATTGTARMQGGPNSAIYGRSPDPTLVLVPDRSTPGMDMDRRTATSRVVQNAAMENTNGDATYDAAADRHSGGISANGTYLVQSAALASQLNHTPYATTRFGDDGQPRAAVPAALRAGLEQASPERGPVVASMSLGPDGGHAVEVRSMMRAASWSAIRTRGRARVNSSAAFQEPSPPARKASTGFRSTSFRIA